MVEGQGGAEVKGAFRSVQTPSAPSAEEQDDDEEEEVISTFGGFLMKADSQSGGAVLAGALAVEGRDGVLLWRAFSHPGYITNTSGDQPLMQVR